MKPIIINADDFGYNENINDAIATCINLNIINSTTIMVNTIAFENAIELATKYSFKDKVGIHLNLTEGKSLTDLSDTGITDKYGNFIRNSINNPRIFFSSFIKSKIKQEIAQQYDKLIEKNLIPTHIDSHHHVHTLPWISNIFFEFAKEKNKKIRLPFVQLRKNFFIFLLNFLLSQKYKKYNLHFSDKFQRVDYFIEHFDKSKTKKFSYELMVHPAYVNNILIDTVDKVDLKELLNKLKEILSRN